MSVIKRRHFLQFAGSSLAAMGLSQLDFLTQAERYGGVLAQPTTRKLAMLVGINEYGTAANLRGCLMDVELQYQLLVNRFGFNPADIVRVVDNGDLKPTRETILQVFQEHLIDQAKDGDVVVFHYSGHGSRVIDPHPVYAGSSFNGTLSPNNPVSAAASGDKIVVPDIMGRTMFLLMKSLKTQNVTTILDSCHSGGGLRGNTVVRSMPEAARGSHLLQRASDEEFELQTKLRSNLQLSFEDFQTDREAGIAKGLGIGSAQLDELAIDMPFDGFHAGAFTYLLTRYLWQMVGDHSAKNVQVNLERSTRAIAQSRRAVQVPVFQPAPNSGSQQRPIYFTSPVTPPAEAVVTNVTGAQIEFWLGGVSSQFLEAADEEARFTILSANREPVGELAYRSRSGLRGIGTLVAGEHSAIAAGMFLREKLVGFPVNPQLKVGIDVSLGDEAAFAQETLNNVLVSSQTGQRRVVASLANQESSLDYLLGRMTESYAQPRAAIASNSDRGDIDMPPIGTVALFTPALEPVPNSHGRVDEPVSDAINRLKPKLKALLAMKVLSSLAATTSVLPVEGEIFSTSGNGSVVPLGGVSGQDTGRGEAVSVSISPFKAGDDIKIRVANRHSRQALHLSCIAIDSDGNMTVIYPAAWDSPDDAALVPSNSELVIPRLEDQVDFKVNGSGYVEVLTLMSTGSLRNSLRGLQEIARGRGQTRGYLSLNEDESLSVLQELLGDVDSLSRGSRSARLAPVSRGDRTLIDRNTIAAFSTVIEIEG